MIKESQYIIKKVSKTEYNIIKFLNGEYSTQYAVTKYPKGFVCSCISGIYRGYCKHKDWISLVKKHQELPINVQIEQVIDKKNMETLVNSVLGV